MGCSNLRWIANLKAQQRLEEDELEELFSSTARKRQAEEQHVLELMEELQKEEEGEEDEEEEAEDVVPGEGVML